MAETPSPTPGDDLDPAPASSLLIREAAPSPPPGPLRDTLAAVGDQRARANEDAMLAVLDAYLSRFIGVVISRLNGPKARRGTKFWEGAQRDAPLETKAVDAGYAVPDKLVTDLADTVRPVALRVAVDAGADVAQRLGILPADRRGDGMFAVDTQAVDKAVDDAVARILGVARHHAEDVRAEITGATATEDSLDRVLDRVQAAHRKGGNWVRMSGRTLANGLANESAALQAGALGVTHMQWVSRRDSRVRPTHRVADGQARSIGDRFQVGSWLLRFPADPQDLPGSWPEVGGCRCSLAFSKPVKIVQDAVKLLSDDAATSAAAEKLIRTAAAQNIGGDGTATPVTLTEPAAGYRLLDSALAAVPGQWLTLGAPLVLGLAAPAVASTTAPVLAVALPAGAQVAIGGGTAALGQGSTLEVVAVTDQGIQARLVT